MKAKKFDAVEMKLRFKNPEDSFSEYGVKSCFLNSATWRVEENTL
jgi:hypothetical protein